MSSLIVFDEDKKSLIRTTIAKQLSKEQFELFMGIAQARGLDPVLGQVHASVHKDKDGNRIMTPIVGIDGFRLIAHRTGTYLGKTEAQFTYEGGKEYPDRVKLTVFRLVHGQRAEFTASARWSEYYPGDKKGFMWRKMPETMLEKVCEAKALRAAFPGDFSGLYVPEEMEQAQLPEPREVKESTEYFEPEKKPNYDALLQAFSGLGISENQILDLYSIFDISQLTPEMVDDLRELYQRAKNNEFDIKDYFNQPTGDQNG